MFILHTFRSRAIMVFLTALLCCGQCSVSAQELTVSLTGSMHNGSSIPCFGKKEGTIVSTVTGGAAPYYYDWSNGESTPSIT
ncbi:MAG TPA: SprB repeat-containing protein, partial [Flavobacteriales bacterium]|nr:SprB repeat-containing protein [Flavobacteriales bacterium]